MTATLILGSTKNSFSQSEKNYKIKTVVIDPGHGGKDPGAIGKYGKEKDIVLSIGLKLGKYIEEYFPDIKVIYTRKTDHFVELFKRAEIANTNKADLFISIHINSNPNPAPKGTETFVMGLHKSESNLEVAKKENSVILKEENYESKYNGFNPDSPESQIVFSLYQDAFLEQSLDLASKVQYQFKERVKRDDRGVKQAGFLVLWKTTMPSILIEAGFLSNPTEEKYLITEQGQDFLASGIYRAFRDYKDNIEKNSTGVIVKNIPEKSSEIYFKVQIASSKQPISVYSEKFKGLENIEEYKTGNIYKYTAGKESDFNKIIELQEKARKRFPDAFVIAFKDGEKITIKKALEEIKN